MHHVRRGEEQPKRAEAARQRERNQEAEQLVVVVAPEEALDLGHLGVTPVVADRHRPALRQPQPADRADGDDPVMDERVRREDDAGTALDGAPAEVRVLAGDGEGLVEPVHALEQVARIEDVAGGEALACVPDLVPVSECAEVVHLLGVLVDAALDQRARRLLCGDQELFEPVRAGTAVVVGEGHQRRVRHAPAEVARHRRAARGLPPQHTQVQVVRALGVRQHRGRRVRRAVVDDHDLELALRNRLRAQRVEQQRQAVGTVVRGDHDGYARLLHRRRRVTALWQHRPRSAAETA